MSEKKRIMGDSYGKNSDQITALTEAINRTQIEVQKLRQSESSSHSVGLKIMMFDDSQEVLDLYRNAAEHLSSEKKRSIIVESILTTRPEQVAEKLFESEGKIDLILIDNNFNIGAPPDHFYAAQVLSELNSFKPKVPRIKKTGIKPRFLPRIVVTQQLYDPVVVERLSVAGADKVVFGKGRGDGLSINEYKTAAQQLLDKLIQPDEWDDIRQRACHRLWRELLLFIEERIRASKASPSTAENAQATMANLMNNIRDWMELAGVADTITFRIAERENGDGILMLRDIKNDGEPFPRYRWDESPLLEKLTKQDLWKINRAEMITRCLTREEVPVDPKKLLSDYSSHGIGVPLTCGHGFFGTIAMTRKRKTPWATGELPKGEKTNIPDTDPARFTALEAEYLARVAQRLALFYEQLLDATRLRRRQQGLLNLAESLARHKSQSEMIHAAVGFLHSELHINSELAYAIGHFDSAPGSEGKVSCRLLEHATGLIYCPPGARVGYEDGHRPGDQWLYNKPLTMENENNIYVSAINRGETQYYIDSQTSSYIDSQNLYPARAVMVEPLSIQGRSIGALEVANKTPYFYGPQPTQLYSGSTGNDNLDLLRSVANLLAQALHQNRLLRFEQALINLATSTGPDDEKKVMDNMAQALYAYIGPGVLLWCESDGNGQLELAAGWCGEKFLKLREIIDTENAVTLQRMDDEVISKWAGGQKDEDTHAIRIFSNYINGVGGIDNYSENKEEITAENDKRMRNFYTKSQYSLVLVDQYVESTNKKERAVGVLSLSFNQHNAVTTEQVQFLRNFGKFIGTYLASVHRYKRFLGMTKQRELAEFLLALSHQARHTLKSNVNSLIDRINVERKGGPGTYIREPDTLVAKLREWAGELSVTHLLPADLSLTQVLPRKCWHRAVMMLKNKVESTNVIISDLMYDDVCICNENILENALFIIIDNALDALKEVANDQLGRKRVWAEMHSDKNSLMIDIFDTGNGFTNDVKDKFGELRVSTKSTGSGTGLYWCKRFLPLVNGKIELFEATEHARVRLTLQRKQNDAEH